MVRVTVEVQLKPAPGSGIGTAAPGISSKVEDAACICVAGMASRLTKIITKMLAGMNRVRSRAKSLLVFIVPAIVKKKMIKNIIYIFCVAKTKFAQTLQV